MHNQQLIFVFWRRPKIERKKKETYRRFGEVKPFVLIGITTYTETAWICLWEDDLWNDSTAIGSPTECRYIRINIWIAFFQLKIIYILCVNFGTTVFMKAPTSPLWPLDVGLTWPGGEPSIGRCPQYEEKCPVV